MELMSPAIIKGDVGRRTVGIAPDVNIDGRHWFPAWWVKHSLENADIYNVSLQVNRPYHSLDAYSDPALTRAFSQDIDATALVVVSAGNVRGGRCKWNISM